MGTVFLSSCSVEVRSLKLLCSAGELDASLQWGYWVRFCLGRCQSFCTCQMLRKVVSITLTVTGSGWHEELFRLRVFRDWMGEILEPIQSGRSIIIWPRNCFWVAVSLQHREVLHGSYLVSWSCWVLLRRVLAGMWTVMLAMELSVCSGPWAKPLLAPCAGQPTLSEVCSPALLGADELSL